MLNERAERRPEFETGVRLQLADGQQWWLPPLAPGNAPDLDAQVAALMEAEDRDEALRGVLALSIVGLSRNYALAPAEIESLLGFGADDEGRQRASQAVLSGAREAVNPLGARSAESEGPPGRRLWTLWTA